MSGRGGFGPELLAEIRARVDIVEVVSRFVGLKRAGENWKGLCPFHQEKTPSFTVHPGKGIFHCFGCGVGGDAFGFLMRQDRLSFPEAVRALAAEVGVALPAPERGAAPAAESRLEGLRAVMARAVEFYAAQLWGPAGARAREYLERRGLDLELARRFRLGYAPEGWDHLLRALRGQEDALQEAGLVVPRQTGGGLYDRFRGRLLFPIADAQGRPVALGGRALGAEEPKYLNSPETPLYVKGQTLYALDLARPAMRERGRAVVVEGYVDCLMAHQHGFTETVAALGTAFTATQLALLRRHADEVVTVFDADAAGQKASARAAELADDLIGLAELGWSVTRDGGFERPGHLPVRVAVLPAGEDPDSFLRSQGADAFRSRLQEARSILSFVMAQALEEEDLTTERGRAAAHARAALVLSKVASADEATVLARQAARALGADPTQLWIEARQLRGVTARRRSEAARRSLPVPAGAAWPPPSLAERDAVALLLHHEAARQALLPELEEEDIEHPGLRAILGGLRRAPHGAPEALMAEMPGDAERSLLASLLIEAPAAADVPAQVAELRHRYEIRRRKRRIRAASLAIARAQDTTAAGAEPGELGRLEREARRLRALAQSRPGGAEPGSERAAPHP
jgi:DNA primase